jgi:hypothetical protein
VADALDRPNAAKSATALLDLIGQVTCSAGFRGCHFINAAAEYPILGIRFAAPWPSIVNGSNRR